MRRGKKLTIIALIVLLAIGFAGVTATLVINGNALFSANDADYTVYFSKAILDGVDETNTIISDNRLNISFTSKELSKLGDTSVLEYEVTNDSRQYDAEVVVECKGLAVNAYTSFTNTLEDQIIPAQSKETGILTITLEKVYAGDEVLEEEYQCTILAKAVEREEISPEAPVVTTYYANAYLSTTSGAMLSNTNLVIYGNGASYTTTDDRGFFHVSGLDSGEYQIYVVLNKTLQELELMSEDELIASATYTGSFNTSSEAITFTNLVVEDSDIALGDPATYEILLDVGEGQESDYNILVVEDKTVGRLPLASHATLAFLGWYSENTEYTSDVIVTSSIPTTLVATYGDGVAKIGEIQYRSIQQAYDSITGNAETEIDVIASHSITANIRGNKNVILDLNNYTVDFSEYFMLNTANLTIDNGTIEAHGLYAIYNDGNTTLESGLVINKDDSSFDNPTYIAPAIANTETGTMNINGATINTEFATNLASSVFNKGTLNVNDGYLTASGSSTGIISNEGTLNMIAGTLDTSTIPGIAIDNIDNSTVNLGADNSTITFRGLKNHQGYLLFNEGDLNINAGNIDVESGSFLVSYNDFTIGSSTTTPTITGSQGESLIDVISGKGNIINANINATDYFALRINAGTTVDIQKINLIQNTIDTASHSINIKGTLNMYAGTITSKSTGIAQVDSGAVFNLYNGTLDISDASSGSCIIAIEGSTVNVGSTGGTVNLLSNASSSGAIISGGDLNIKEGTINFTNGYGIYSVGTVNVGEQNKTLKITSAPEYMFFTIGNGGVANINNGEISSSDAELLSVLAGGTANINGGTLTIDSDSYVGRLIGVLGTLNVNGGTLVAKGTSYGLIQAENTAILNLTGGIYDNSAGKAHAIGGLANTKISIGSDNSNITMYGTTGYPSIYSAGPVEYLGGTLTHNNSILFGIANKLTINKGTFNINEGTLASITNTGTLDIYTGTFNLDNQTARSRMLVNRGIVNIFDGTFTAKGEVSGIIDNIEGSTLNITGGTYNTVETQLNPFVIYETSTMNLGSATNTITFNGNPDNYTIYIMGTLNVTEGNIDVLSADLIATVGNVNIGETGKALNFSLAYGTLLLDAFDGANVNIYNMSAEATESRLIFNNAGSTMNIYGGNFSANTVTQSARMIRNDGTLTIYGGTYSVTAGSFGVLSVGNGSKTTIISAVMNGATNSKNVIYVEAGATIDFGKTGSSAELKVTNDSTTTPTIAVEGTANFYYGEYSASTSNVLIVGKEASAGTVNIYGGTFTNSSSDTPTISTNIGTITMTGGTVINNSGGYTIHNESGTATQTGGTSANNYNVKTS